MRFLLLLPIFCFSALVAVAEVPHDIESFFKTEMPKAKFRLDQVLVDGEKKWLLIKPQKPCSLKTLPDGTIEKYQKKQDHEEKISLVLKTEAKDYLFSNAWIYTPIENKTIKSFDFYPNLLQDILLASMIHQEFIVPKQFKLPRDLAFLSGRIPIELGDIELASDREMIFRKKMQTIKDNKPFRFLTYSYDKGVFAEMTLEKSFEKDFFQEKEVKLENLKYLSHFAKVNDRLFFSDMVSGSIFEVIKKDFDFDATKPIKKQDVEADVENDLEFKEVFNLKNIGIDDGIKSFEFNLNQSSLYLVTKNSSDLLIIDFKKQELLKKLELPHVIEGFHLLSRSADSADTLIFLSKATKKIFFLNTYDLRISRQIALKDLDANFDFIPYSIVSTANKVIVAVKKISQHNTQEIQNGLLIFDLITSELEQFLVTDMTPTQLSVDASGKSLLVLMQDDKQTKLQQFDAKSFTLQKSLSFDADISQASSLYLIEDENLILVPSSVSNNLVIVDGDSLLEIKKIKLTNPINLLQGLK